MIVSQMINVTIFQKQAYLVVVIFIDLINDHLINN